MIEAEKEKKDRYVKNGEEVYWEDISLMGRPKEPEEGDGESGYVSFT
jgi:hypothetical protein